MHRLIAIAVFTGGLALPQANQAQTMVPGRLLASNCFQCHRTDGRPDSIMNAHARGYTDQQLWELSVHFSQLPG